MAAYSILRAPTDDVYCAITKGPEGMRNPARPSQGASMAGSYKAPLDFAMSKLVNAKGIQIPDVVLNAIHYLIVSDRLKTLLEEHAGDPIEFLPFRLLNHKGRVAAERIWVANVLGTVPCADRARSEGSDSPFKRGQFLRCTRLAVDERKVPRDRKVFRTDLFPPAVFVRNDVRKLIEQARLEVRFVAPGDPL